MRKISSWMNYLKRVEKESENLNYLCDQINQLSEKGIEVGNNDSDWYYRNGDNEYRANLYYKNMSLLKMNIRVPQDIEESISLEITRPRRQQKGAIKLYKSFLFSLSYFEWIFKKRVFRLNEKRKHEFTDFIDRIKRLINIIDNLYDKNANKFQSVSKENIFDYLDQNIIRSNLSNNNFNRLSQYIGQVMREKNIFCITSSSKQWDLVQNDVFSGNYEYLNDILNQSIEWKNILIWDLKNIVSDHDLPNTVKATEFYVKEIAIRGGLLEGTKLVLRSEDIDKGNNKYSLFVGDNGTGKTLLLSMIEKLFLGMEDSNLNLKDKNGVVISYVLNGIEYQTNQFFADEDLSALLPSKLITNSSLLQDRFTFRSQKDVNDYDNMEFYSYLGIRSSSNAAFYNSRTKNTILNLLDVNMNAKSEKVTRLLEFVGVNPKFRVSFNYQSDKNLDYLSLYNKVYDDSIPNTKNKFELIFDYSHANSDEQFDKLDALYSATAELIRKEKNLKNLKLEFFKDSYFDFEHASSGESNLIYTMLNFIAKIKPGSLILIDEPEVSLHPKWQYNYIDLLDDLFKGYGCHFFIASHSHFIVGDTKEENSHIVRFMKKNHELRAEVIDHTVYGWSAEDILYSVFKMSTTRNMHVISDVKEIIETIETGEVSANTNAAVMRLKDLELNSHDPINNLLEKVREIID